MRTPSPIALLLSCLAVVGGTTAVRSAPIQNSASGTINGATLNPSAATVTLNRSGSAVTSVMAEITPNAVLAGRTGYAFEYDLRPEINPGDSGVRTIEIAIPPGYTNVSVVDVRVQGVAQATDCPTPGAGGYCATIVGNMVTVELGQSVTLDQAAIQLRFSADTPPTTSTASFDAWVVNGPLRQSAVPGDADGDPGDANSTVVDVTQSQGVVLELTKIANKIETVVGDVVTYSVGIANTATLDVVQVEVEDDVPPNFKYLPGSARLDGAPIAEPTGDRVLLFDVGTVPALVDTNGNGRADPGEQGYRTLTYRLVVGSGASPGSHVNTAVARDFCDVCLISNVARADVEVTLDMVFDLGTIIGKVFEDRDGDGRQDRDEPGVAAAMVALDDGTYALTDEHGRYHFPAVLPGQRMVKINLHSLPPGSTAVTANSRVLWITPGLMVKASFGVRLDERVTSIGSPPVPAVSVTSSRELAPLDVRGNAESLSALVNGQEIPLPSMDVRMRVAALDEAVQISGDRLTEPVTFQLDVEPVPIESWKLTVVDSRGRPVRTLDGIGLPPETLTWDGRDDRGTTIVSGEIYQYQLELYGADDSRLTSSRRLFGVNRTSAIALDLLGDAFESGSHRLSARARQVLSEAAEVLRGHPTEKVLIEGHTDSIGNDDRNLQLSRRRAEAAADYLVESLGLPRDRFILRWFGEQRPAAPNDFEEGRALNRRVEIKGEFVNEEDVRILDRFRSTPSASINGAAVELREHGRFSAVVDTGAEDRLDIRMTDSTGRSAAVTLQLPELNIEQPAGSFLLPDGGSINGCSASLDGTAEVRCRLTGRTQPGNVIVRDGIEIPTTEEGRFSADLTLSAGRNDFDLLSRNPQGYVRIGRLSVDVTERDAEGHRLTVSGGTPDLTVRLPPEGLRLPTPLLRLAGLAAPGCEVRANGHPLPVEPDGKFAGEIELPRGRSRLIIEVTDDQGRSGSIVREVEVARHELFMMAFADGTFGKLEGRGSIESAEVGKADDYYTEGRVAFYLKGRIAGKWLITSAFDSGVDELGSLFDDLDGESTRRLLTHLDPDKHYPVYGDSSTVVYDTESQGKLYLALDSETVHAVIGNYPLSLGDTELSAYRRTLFGGHFAYRSLSRTKYGEPDTQVVVFGAKVRQAHARDELRATGGSLYYLSQRDVIEGSEEITLVVRDKHTGLVLSQTRQRRELDYTIKYEEGRLMFRRPISSVDAGGTLVNQGLLSGHPVWVHADYERRVEGLDKTASGGRVRRQLGDHVAVGGTYVKDELQAGSYEMTGMDAELRLGQGTRLSAEVADSTGSDSTVFVSTNGGLTYVETAPDGTREGTAWKAAAELDIGEWFGRPDRQRLGLYYKQVDPGFSSNGSFAEQGTEKLGLQADLKLSERDSLRVEFHIEERKGGLSAGADGETRTGAARWDHNRKRWGIAAEFFTLETEGLSGASQQESRLGATRAWARPTEKLTTSLEHQQSLSGPDNDQTTLGLEYRALPSLVFEVRGTDGTRGQAAEGGLVLTRGEGEVYLTERLSETAGQSKASTILGARSPLGPKTKVYSEYQLERDERDERLVRLLGLQRQWEVGRGLRFVFKGETADTTAGTSGKRSAFSAGLSYANDRGLQASSRQELRFDEAGGRRMQVFTTNQLDVRVNPDFTLLARYRYSKTEDRDTEAVSARFDERVVGVAFRPTGGDRFNSLMRYTRLLDWRPSAFGTLSEGQRVLDVLSVDTSVELHRRLEWLSKGAIRLQQEEFPDGVSVETRTYLAIHRLNYNFWQQLDLGLEYRILAQREANDQRAGWMSELSWELIRNFRIGAGFNFTDFSDDEFSNNDYSLRGWFLRVQGRY